MKTMKTSTKKKTAKATTETPADLAAIEQHVARTEHFDATDAKAAAKKARAKTARASKKATAKLRRLGEAAGVIAPAAKAPKKTAIKPAKKTTAAKSAEPKPGTKSAKVIAMLERKGGATAAELLKATDWQPHSLRGFISIFSKKTGRKIASTRSEKGERVYAL
jgi:hypothetical protein